jgi:3'-5' exonuclease
MPRLVFDIETTGVDFESLDNKTREVLMEQSETDEERRLIREGLGFSPLTGRVVAIGILNPDTNKGAVYYQQQKNEKEEEDKIALYVPCANEKEILKRFWEIATHYDQLVTFNGYAFDCPFIMIRSAVLGVKPTINLMQTRYSRFPHFDLMDGLTNFGAARFKKPLHMWCQAFGIKSPKEDGTTGNDVARLFKENKCLDIAKYCAGDIRATAELLNYWEKYLSGK